MCLMIGRRLVLAISGGIDSMVLLDAAAAVLPARRLVVATFDHGTGPEAARAAARRRRTVAEVGNRVRQRACADVARERSAAPRGTVALSRGALRAISTESCVPPTPPTTRSKRCSCASCATPARVGSPRSSPRATSFVRCLASRARDVIAYARRRRLTWVEDPSNASPKYLRNRIRARPAAGAAARARRRSTRSCFEVRDNGGALALGGRGVRRADCSVYASSQAAGIGRRRGDARRISGARASRFFGRRLPLALGVTLDRRGTLRLAEFTLRSEGGCAHAAVRRVGGDSLA